MKKFISFLITLTLILSLYPVSLLGAKAPSNKITTTVTGFKTPSTVDARNEKGKYLILNEDGTYGGSLNDALYGKGAPLNGKYDVDNSDYYYNGDYYNMKSNYTIDKEGETVYQRYIFPNFSPYQQTMQDTSGIACIVMILNYLGYDVSEYSELYLLKKYEELNGKTVYGNGTTPDGLVNLVNSLSLNGVTANATEIDKTLFKIGTNTDYAGVMPIFRNCIKEGKFLVMRYQSPNGYGYKVLIGHDSKQEPYTTSYDLTKTIDLPQDDYFIFAEPNDNYDHFQDGYTANRANTVIRWWFNMDYDGYIDDNIRHEYFIIDPSIDLDLDDSELIDTSKHIQEDPESLDTSDGTPGDGINGETVYNMYKYAVSLGADGTDTKLYEFPRNGKDMWSGTKADGSSGILESKKYGSYRAGAFGIISTGGGTTDRFDLPYAKISNFYNMGSEGTRILLPNYTVLQQTMAASCGVCAVTSVLKYYGKLTDKFINYVNNDMTISAAKNFIGKNSEGNDDITHYNFERAYTYAYDNNQAFDDTVIGGTENAYHKITLKDLGYTTHCYESKRVSDGTDQRAKNPVFKDYYAFSTFVKYHLGNDRPIIANISPSGGHYVTIIGYDDMGNDYIYDDVIIIADSTDYWDGYQDGYCVYSANQFYRQFTNSANAEMFSTMVIYKN